MDVAGLSRRARAHGGPFTNADAEGFGIGRGRLSSWHRTGLLRRLYRGVHVSALQPDSWELRVAGAVLAAGDRAVVSHGTAAVLHGMYWVEPGDRSIEITVPHERRVQVEGVVIHRSVHLDDVDITRIGHLPVTTQARTLRDLAGSRPRWRLERAVDEVVAEGGSARRIRETLDACGPVPGRAQLRGLLDRLDPDVAATRSEIERLGLRLARRVGIDGLVAGYTIRDASGDTRILDLAIPELRIGIEIDSSRHHGTTLARHRDGIRQNGIVLAGGLILRFDVTDLKEHPDRVLGEIRGAIALQRAGGLGA